MVRRGRVHKSSEMGNHAVRTGKSGYWVVVALLALAFGGCIVPPADGADAGQGGSAGDPGGAAAGDRDAAAGAEGAGFAADPVLDDGALDAGAVPSDPTSGAGLGDAGQGGMGGLDAGMDAGLDAGLDAAVEAAADASVDASVDDEGDDEDAGEALPEDGCFDVELASTTGWVARDGMDHWQANGRSCPDVPGLQERSFHFVAPVAGNWRFETNTACSGVPVLSLREPVCGGQTLATASRTAGLFGNARIDHWLDEGEAVNIAIVPESDAPHVPRPAGLHITLGAEAMCGNGEDDDYDHAVDCADFDCEGRTACPYFDENDCYDADIGSATGLVLAPGDFGGCVNDAMPLHTMRWQAPTDGTWRFEQLPCNGDDTTLAILEPSCFWNELASKDDSAGLFGGSIIDMQLRAGETVLVQVGHPTPSNERPATVRIYPAGHEADCGNGIDDDMDGRTDCDDAGDCRDAEACEVEY